MDEPARPWSVRLGVWRHRRVVVASAVTCVVGLTLVGLIGLSHWQGHRAVQSDTRTVLAQSIKQLERAFQSRRGTLTFISDTLRRSPALSPASLQAMGSSAIDHTRHLLGAGSLAEGAAPVWWVTPQPLSRQELSQLTRAMAERAALRGAWRVPSTFTAGGPARPLLVMFEPLRARAQRPRAVVAGVFDLKPLLADFFAATLALRHPVKLLDGSTALYRSEGWREATAEHTPVIAQQSFAVDAARWTIQMQPGSTRVAQTLSWLTILLMALSVLAGIGVTAVVWILATRTFLLQRAVARRTAALRRTTQRLRQLAMTDELTGLYNRRFFLERWQWEYERAKRYGRPISCLMIDVNGFKQVNDRLGHQAGDTVLQSVARELKTLLRQSDILARFGGDEFIIGLPETDLAQARTVAEKLRRLAVAVPVGGGRVPPVTLSVGVSQSGRPQGTAHDLIQAADASLYTHKRHPKPSSTP